MEIVFGGINIDADIVEAIRKGKIIDPAQVTPESVPAGYARVSRYSKSVTELRKEAREDVAKARKSNENIVFGMGHQSIAEHGNINFDILGISRLAIETLELHRIGVAYTEKSQRYVTMNKDYVTPLELRDLPPKFTTEFHQSIQRGFDLYNETFPKLLTFHEEQNPQLVYQRDHAEDKSDRKKAKDILEGKAKEDARYILSMAMEGQLGATFNFRELEYIIRTMRYHELAEVREMSEKFYDIGSREAPSLIKLFGTPLEEEFIKNFNSILIKESEKFRDLISCIPQRKDVELLRYNEDGDNRVIAGLLSKGSNMNYKGALSLASILINEGKAEDYLLSIFKNLTEFDTLPREFELTDYLFNIITSSTNFAQFKRQRMMTLLPGRYNTNLTYTLPQSVIEMGLESKFKEELDKSSELFHEVQKHNPYVAEYFLTNAHRRENVVKLNLRELYHFSRLREDIHAQWDIRHNTNEMVRLAKEVNPLTTMFLGGKHEFDKIKASLYKNG